MGQSLSAIQREILKKVGLKKKQGLTTGEVSKMLGGVISQRTVIRFFDRGLLTGWRSPMTGRRMIDPKSVKVLAKKRGLTTREASRMLGISIYRIVKLFEQGILAGWKNPATGWRVIDLLSVEILARKSEITLPSKKQTEEKLKAKALKWKWNAIPLTQKKG